MTAALCFEVGCPSCGDTMHVIRAGAPELRTSTATMRCDRCRTDHQITVTLRTGRRYSSKPLFDWVLARNDITCDLTGADGTTGFLARRLHITEEKVRRYQHSGLTEPVADRLATTLNVHPRQIWPEFADDELVDA